MKPISLLHSTIIEKAVKSSTCRKDLQNGQVIKIAERSPEFPKKHSDVGDCAASRIITPNVRCKKPDFTCHPTNVKPTIGIRLFHPRNHRLSFGNHPLSRVARHG
ncbi:hypothetical protein IAQ61_000454 [Plenodomus lingam]|uniref:uncharacterized protein n=1 Tax=Leptosphaeria maculans TaxID=5022 RepID=UPI0033291412|nr:hypothetical protein IAQ61_000454 [Plenodomus lingam]